MKKWLSLLCGVMVAVFICCGNVSAQGQIKVVRNYAKPGEVMYHTGLTKEQIGGAKYALLPGDPGRVEALAKAMGPAKYVGNHRDFTSWLTSVNGQPVLVMSTGMGGPCITFAVEELARLGVTNFIRVGTCGSLQEDLNIGDVDERGVQLRPHIVWFGEMVPAMEEAAEIASQADIFLVIGTSMKVYPAAGLIDFIPPHCELYVIDKGLDNHFTHQDNFYQLGASEGMRALKKRLLDKA